MYLEDGNIQDDALFQGDIVSDVHFIGALNLNSILYLTSAADPNTKTAWSINAKPRFGDAIVLSHNCEISKENTTKVTSIILAPLRDVNTATKPEKLQELIESNIIRPGQNGSYLKYFYLQPNDRFVYTNGVIADFSKCFSVRNQSFELLLQNKIAQLQEDIVNAMSLKFALYFHRNNENAA